MVHVNWVNVIVSGEKMSSKLHLLLKARANSTLFVTLIFDDFCIIAKKSRDGCIHLVNCLYVSDFFSFSLVSCAEICRYNIVCQFCCYLFRSH